MAETIIHPVQSVDVQRWFNYESVRAIRGFEAFNNALRTVTSARWVLRYPLQRRVLFGYTVGEIFFLLPAAVFLVYLCVTYYKDGDMESSGSLASICFAVPFGLVMKNSIITFLAGIPFERLIRYHRYAAYLAITFGLLHGLTYYFVKGNRRRLDDDDDELELSGWIAQGSAFAILLTSLWPIRRYFFNFFIIMHVLCFIGIVVGLLLHEASDVLFGAGLWLLDWLYRAYVVSVLHKTMANFECKGGNIVKVTFQDSKFSYKGGQYAFILVPEISVWQWHPVSITSSPHDKTVVLNIKASGDWTKALFDHVERQGGMAILKFAIDGCYGEPLIDIDSDRYKSFLLFAGGIGITPLLSVAHDLRDQGSRGRPLNKLKLVWSVRESTMVDAILDQTSQQPAENDMNPNDPLNFEIYVTSAKESGNDSSANNLPLKVGRPDCSSVFDEMILAAKASQEKRVAVMVCGPSALVDHVRALSSSKSTKDVHFDFHYEVFEF